MLVTGHYLITNHVLIVVDSRVAAKYAEMFEFSWANDAKAPAFQKSPLSNGTFSFSSGGLPPVEVTFSPHNKDEAARVLAAVAKRIAAEGKKPKSEGSVMFAVMQVDGSVSPVYTALRKLHANTGACSYGITDPPKGIA